MNSGGETAPFVIHDDDAPLGHCRNICSATAARQANPFPVLFNPVGIQVAETIDFRAADKSSVDAITWQKMHHVVEPAATQRARYIRWIAHG